MLLTVRSMAAWNPSTPVLATPASCSLYDWASSSFLWTPVTCLLFNVTYAHRVDQASAFNYCTVPQEGSDAFLFAALALLAAACSRGKLAVVWVLVAGKLGRGMDSGLERMPSERCNWAGRHARRAITAVLVLRAPCAGPAGCCAACGSPRG